MYCKSNTTVGQIHIVRATHAYHASGMVINMEESVAVSDTNITHVYTLIIIHAESFIAIKATLRVAQDRCVP